MDFFKLALARLRKLYGFEVAQTQQTHPEVPVEEVVNALPLYHLNTLLVDTIEEFVRSAEDPDMAAAEVMSVLMGLTGSFAGLLSRRNYKLFRSAEDAGFDIYDQQFRNQKGVTHD